MLPTMLIGMHLNCALAGLHLLVAASRLRVTITKKQKLSAASTRYIVNCRDSVITIYNVNHRVIRTSFDGILRQLNACRDSMARKYLRSWDTEICLWHKQVLAGINIMGTSKANQQRLPHAGRRVNVLNIMGKKGREVRSTLRGLPQVSYAF